MSHGFEVADIPKWTRHWDKSDPVCTCQGQQKVIPSLSAQQTSLYEGVTMCGPVRKVSLCLVTDHQATGTQQPDQQAALPTQ